jgi:Tetracyclin repressor-like, C-terminal domain
LPRLLGDVANDPELHAIFYDNLVEPRRAQMRAILQRAAARGEIRDDVDIELIIDLFAGPVVYRLLITGGDYAQLHAVDDQLDALLNGLAPRG